MANTVIQLKYSSLTGTPPSLNVAEPAYSNVSNKLWINDETGVVAIGGKHYTQQIDGATTDATANTLVLRDLSGNVSFNSITSNTIFANIVTAQLDGTSNAATQLETPRTIALGGDVNGSVIFDGTTDVNINVGLISTGVSPGNYGSTTKIPTFEVDINGRLIYAANVDVSTTFAFSADVGSPGTINLLVDTLAVVGGDGITTVADDSNNTIVIGVDNTVIRTNSNSQQIDGNITITGNLNVNSVEIMSQLSVGDVNITGNLIVTGETVYANTTTVNLSDNIITLNADIPQSFLPSENAGIEVDRGLENNVGLIWNESTNQWTFTNDGVNYSSIASSASESYSNSAYLHANSAYVQANTATTNAATADQRAVTSGSYANSAFVQANTSDQRAVTSGSYANSAFSKANTAPTTTGTGASGNWSIDVTGNAATATLLQNARTINGVSFNGSENIEIESYIEDDDTTNANRYLIFVDDTTASYKRLNEDSSLTYNPSANTLTAGILKTASITIGTSSVTGNGTSTLDGFVIDCGTYT